ncbi:MAG: DNA gyrase subunit A [Clostridia bacterium]|nr:DNA gyrase subunit A [Clostridia bacterium]
MARKDEIIDYEFPEQKIVDIGMEKEVSNSFIQYAMSVIVSRALPDVRDGMKPGQRRILYSMYEDHLTHDNPFRKAATTVGNVLGRYHPHGDAAVYGSLVRMAQSFSYRYPLIEGHGNFGTVDGDPPAAYRYTEARLATIAEEMMADLDKEVVRMDKNFDNTRDEPSVLPSRFPNLLVNGAVGIAVGMATNIPPHNLGEVIDGTIFRMENPDCTVAQLMEYIKGPDFPTKGTIYGINGIAEAYTTGRGRIMVRATAAIDEEKRTITVTDVPYMLAKSALIENIADLVKNRRIDGITDIRDLSNKEGGIRIVIDYRRDANGEVILNQLYRMSRLQDTCSVNMLAIVNGEPKILNLPQVLDRYIEHQEQVVTARTEYNLKKARARAHILEGYIVAMEHIDEIVEIMKTSDSIVTAKATLCERYSLSEIQAQSIVEMTLGKLTGLERQKTENELEKVKEQIEEYVEILGDPGRVRQIIKDEMLEIKRKYADQRLTDIVAAEKEILYEDLIERHTAVVTLTKDGYIKRIPADVYRAQRRGGKGIIGMHTKEDDVVDKVAAVDSHSVLMLFTNLGKVFSCKAYVIPEATRTSKGSYAANVVGLTDGEKITSMISVPGFDETLSLTMVTKNGTIKRCSLSDFERNNKSGKRAVSLREGDELVFVGLTEDDDELVMATSDGYALRFRAGSIRVMGRTATGVRGMRLRENEAEIVGVAVVREGKALLTVTENGYGKRTDFEEFAAHARGGKGMRCHRIGEKTGRVVAIAEVADTDEILVITDMGVMIRTPVSGISNIGRSASGVRVMKTGDGRVSSLAVLEASDEPEDELPDTGETESGGADSPAQDDGLVGITDEEP